MSIEETIQLAVRAELERQLRPIRELLERGGGASNDAGPLSVPEAARQAHRHPDTVRRAIKAGELVAFRPAGAREWAVDPTELRRWLGRGRGRIAPVLDLEAEARQALARATGGRR